MIRMQQAGEFVKMYVILMEMDDQNHTEYVLVLTLTPDEVALTLSDSVPDVK